MRKNPPVRKNPWPKFLDRFFSRPEAPSAPPPKRHKPNNARRDEILGFSTEGDDVIYFKSLSADQVSALIAEGFMSPNDRQGASPTSAEFLRFMEKWPTSKVHGYAVHPERSDYRVTIEGIHIPVSGMTLTKKRKLASDLKLLYKQDPPDEFDKSKSEWYLWWD